MRYASPIIQFQRTLTCDHEMNGHTYRKGEKVVLFYLSANRDEEVFAEPDRFDIARKPEPSRRIRGAWARTCASAHTWPAARLTAMFRELFTRVPGIRASGEPDFCCPTSTTASNACRTTPRPYARPVTSVTGYRVSLRHPVHSGRLGDPAAFAAVTDQGRRCAPYTSTA